METNFMFPIAADAHKGYKRKALKMLTMVLLWNLFCT